MGIRASVGTFGALYDYAMQGVSEAAASPMIPHYDALRRLGDEQSMRQYPEESWTDYRLRLNAAWNTWDYAGDERSVVDQLAAAGMPGAQVFRFTESGSWSEFVVFYPAGSHPVTSKSDYGDPGIAYGDPGLSYGPAGITAEQLHGFKDAIIDWKPARWKCPYILWELSGATYGTGHTYGEPGLVYGGEQVRTTVQN